MCTNSPPLLSPCTLVCTLTQINTRRAFDVSRFFIYIYFFLIFLFYASCLHIKISYSLPNINSLSLFPLVRWCHFDKGEMCPYFLSAVVILNLRIRVSLYTVSFPNSGSQACEALRDTSLLNISVIWFVLFVLEPVFWFYWRYFCYRWLSWFRIITITVLYHILDCSSQH